LKCGAALRRKHKDNEVDQFVFEKVLSREPPLPHPLWNFFKNPSFSEALSDTL
jgi:hypothetical protein